MHVDEARGDNAPGGVDRPGGVAVGLADRDDLAVLDAEIADETRLAAAIDDRAAGNLEVVAHGLLLNASALYVGLRRRRKGMAKHKIALIPGDGIGKEVLPEGVRVLEAAARRFNFQLEFTDFDWSCDRLLQTGKMMPDDGMEQLKAFESIFLGAVGWPGVPDHVSLWGLLIPIRRDFDEYVNLRPVRLFEGVPSPLANRKPGEIDFWVVRENTEGEYSQL